MKNLQDQTVNTLVFCGKGVRVMSYLPEKTSALVGVLQSCVAASTNPDDLMRINLFKTFKLSLILTETSNVVLWPFASSKLSLAESCFAW